MFVIPEDSNKIPLEQYIKIYVLKIFNIFPLDLNITKQFKVNTLMHCN